MSFLSWDIFLHYTRLQDQACGCTSSKYIFSQSNLQILLIRWVAAALLKAEILPAVMVFASLVLKIVSVEPQFVISISHSNFFLAV